MTVAGVALGEENPDALVTKNLRDVDDKKGGKTKIHTIGTRKDITKPAEKSKEEADRHRGGGKEGKEAAHNSTFGPLPSDEGCETKSEK